MFDVFSISGFQLPKDFLWGSATAGHQVEGNNKDSDFWYREMQAQKRNPNACVSGWACNSYEMWRDDVELLSKLKHQVYRMSMEWARIEPREGEFNQKEVDHYVRIFSFLKEKGIKLCLTIVHCSLPQWFYEKGGLGNIENLHYFERYLEYILPKISSFVDFWCVLNEFNLSSGDFKYNAIQFHARGYHVIKKYSSKPISSAHALIQYESMALRDRFDDALSAYKDALNNEFFFHAIRTGELVVYDKDVLYSKEIKDSVDYWAINTYVRNSVNSRVAKSNCFTERYDFEKIDMIDEAFYLNKINPESIVHNLSRLKDKPVYITENGCACNDDNFRIIFIAEYLSAINQAIKLGVDVKGYLYWSLLDNYEWGSYKPRFGLVDVDRNNGFKRTIKESGYFLREIIEKNGFSQEMLKRYLKEIPKATYHLNK